MTPKAQVTFSVVTTVASFVFMGTGHSSHGHIATTAPPSTTVTSTTTLPTTTDPTTTIELLALTEGMSGPRVLEVQQRLKDLGYRIVVDGDFGPKTREVVKKFQVEHGLRMDGVVGPQTLAALGLDS